MTGRAKRKSKSAQVIIPSLHRLGFSSVNFYFKPRFCGIGCAIEAHLGFDEDVKGCSVW